jgi:hypothetical protein
MVAACLNTRVIANGCVIPIDWYNSSSHYMRVTHCTAKSSTSLTTTSFDNAPFIIDEHTRITIRATTSSHDSSSSSIRPETVTDTRVNIPGEAEWVRNVQSSIFGYDQIITDMVSPPLPSSLSSPYHQSLYRFVIYAM